MSGRERALNSIAFCGLAMYFVLGIVSFYAFVEPSLNGTNGWRAYGDSGVYMDTAAYLRDQGGAAAVVALLSLARNLIIPAAVALALRTAPHIAIFNGAVFFVALVILGRTFSQFRWYIFLPLILASATTYEALFTLNKEIFVLFCAVIFARWFKTRSGVLICFLILFSLALRWEQAFAILIVLILFRLKVPPKYAAAVLIIGISIAYPIAMAWVTRDIPEDLIGSSSSDLYGYMNVLQNHGLYFALLLPKMIIALLSQVVRFWEPFADPKRLHDLNNGVYVLFDQLCFCTVVLASWRKRLWVVANPVIYFLLIYALVFLAAPMNQPRYLYMLFVLMTLVLSAPELQSLRISPEHTTTRDRNNFLSIIRQRKRHLPVLPS